jgi:hypothetical protein
VRGASVQKAEPFGLAVMLKLAAQAGLPPVPAVRTAMPKNVMGEGYALSGALGGCSLALGSLPSGTPESGRVGFSAPLGSRSQRLALQAAVNRALFNPGQLINAYAGIGRKP